LLFIVLSKIIDSQNISHVNLLKIDVERFELEVLQGIRGEHWNLIDQIIVEVHDFDNRLNIITNLLISHGFSVNVEKPEILKESNIFVLYARKLHLLNNPTRITLTPHFKWSSNQYLEKSVREYLRERIPHYMIPAKFITVDHIPTTINGKIDFTKLKELYSIQSKSNEIPKPNTPDNTIKSKLLHLWQ